MQNRQHQIAALRGRPTRRHEVRSRRRWLKRFLVLSISLTLLAFLPVPWLVARTPEPLGMAWQLDGRLQYNGHRLDPPGSWVGLTAGRPPIVAEVVLSWFDGETKAPRNLTGGSVFNSPAMAEPAAIAIGLREAGVAIDMTTMVEAREPLIGGLPPRVSVTHVNGRAISSRDDWSLAIGGLGEINEITASGGDVLSFDGNSIPYSRVEMLDSPTDFDVSLAGWARFIPDRLYRNLSLGRSHGLLLALAAYFDATGEGVATDRRIGATGVIYGDGSVGPIGGLAAKARAADRAGVEILFYPAAQRCEQPAIMEGLGATGMTMVPVATLSEAIAVLPDADSMVSADLVCEV